jgi:hypothetical protein
MSEPANKWSPGWVIVSGLILTVCGGGVVGVPLIIIGAIALIAANNPTTANAQTSATKFVKLCPHCGGSRFQAVKHHDHSGHMGHAVAHIAKESLGIPGAIVAGLATGLVAKGLQGKQPKFRCDDCKRGFEEPQSKQVSV